MSVKFVKLMSIKIKINHLIWVSSMTISCSSRTRFIKSHITWQFVSDHKYTIVIIILKFIIIIIIIIITFIIIITIIITRHYDIKICIMKSSFLIRISLADSALLMLSSISFHRSIEKNNQHVQVFYRCNKAIITTSKIRLFFFFYTTQTNMAMYVSWIF